VDAADAVRPYSRDVRRWPGADLRDLLIPLGIAVVATVEVLSVRPPNAPVTVAVEWAACLLLVLRRRWPLPVCTLAGGVLLLPLVGPAVDDLTAPILIVGLAGFTLGRRLPDLRGAVVMALFLGLVLRSVFSGVPAHVGDVVWVSTLLLPPYGVGVLIRSLDDRNRRLALERERAGREAAAAERTRIARELHDVLAHSVSAMVVQAAAAEDLVRADPDRAAAILRDVTSVGRRALAETGQLLRLVRGDDELGLQPDPGLDRLGDLIAGTRRGGLDVELAVEGSLGGLSPTMDLSAYRIVQEALTNGGRHGAGPVSVRLVRTPHAVEIIAENPVGTAESTGGGLGLIGMAERVAVLGGRIEHGPTADGRYRLAVSLPASESTVAPASTVQPAR
jgi:signal transduction histidine kinase